MLYPQSFPCQAPSQLGVHHMLDTARALFKSILPYALLSEFLISLPSITTEPLSSNTLLSSPFSTAAAVTSILKVEPGHTVPGWHGKEKEHPGIQSYSASFPQVFSRGVKIRTACQSKNFPRFRVHGHHGSLSSVKQLSPRACSLWSMVR